jgi:hypothetical protein
VFDNRAFQLDDEARAPKCGDDSVGLVLAEIIIP